MALPSRSSRTRPTRLPAAWPGTSRGRGCGPARHCRRGTSWRSARNVRDPHSAGRSWCRPAGRSGRSRCGTWCRRPPQGQASCQSWMALPSGSCSEAKRPFGYVSGSTSTSIPAARSWSTKPSRSLTRKLMPQPLGPRYGLSQCSGPNGANTIGPADGVHTSASYASGGAPTPRCSAYQRDSAPASNALKKNPPMPSTRCTAPACHLAWSGRDPSPERPGPSPGAAGTQRVSRSATGFRRREAGPMKTTKAIVAKLVAKPDAADEVATFLTGALDLANAEAGTPVWFALRTDDVTFWIVDAFPGDAERQAHINGEIAKALMANAERLLAQPPDLGMADVLAAKIPG